MDRVKARSRDGGAELIALRLRAGYSVAEAARKAGVSWYVLQSAESGTTPRPNNAKKIADLYGVDVLVLWPLSGNGAR